MNTLERIQYHCALAITGAWQGTSFDKIYDQLGWESLTDRRYCRRLFHFYKIHNDLSPSYLKDSLPSLTNHPYTTRSEFVLHELKCNSETVSTLTALDVGIDLAICYVTFQTSSPLKNVFLLDIDLLLEVYLVFLGAFSYPLLYEDYGQIVRVL